MGVQDLFITPIYLFLFVLGAYLIRPHVTRPETRKYFIPALLARFAGAIALGLIYQFYYDGGDTFNYFTHGSRWIWEAFMDDFATGFKLLMESGGSVRSGDTFEFSQHIWYYRDPNSFVVVRIAALIDLLTFHTYTATALFFACFSFSGLWAFYSVVVSKYSGNYFWFAIAILFVPSTVFWGSGILKDTMTLGALGWLTFGVIRAIDFHNRNLTNWLIILFSAYLIYSIKSYIIICYVPMIFIWLYWKYQSRIRSTALKILVAPMLLALFLLAGYFTLDQVSSYSQKYALDTIADRAAMTAYDIRYGWGARTGGEGGYDIGLPDGTWGSMVGLMPRAINVSLFRPYLWEVRNPLMLLSAIESLTLLILTIYALVVKKGFRRIFQDPFLVFCLAFGLVFAFAVGLSTANFGTLMRYKIPMMGFYMLVLISGGLDKKDG
ncbi:hypothetical protein [Marinoscillum sp. MHG1-6]|uniref:hypothetical protein n=1 Tax=Marinoscillum sp. MHG1-6 TaxID=2959627 RepID=UPI002157440B|nr:hypothetical protein [Marinoscillum sp. MHG1-6]